MLNQTTEESKEIDSIIEVFLGIEFKKSFHDNNTIKYFVNNEEVAAFSTQLIGKNKKELVISIIAKADE